jgi:hypothetical protein
MDMDMDMGQGFIATTQAWNVDMRTCRVVAAAAVRDPRPPICSCLRLARVHAAASLSSSSGCVTRVRTCTRVRMCTPAAFPQHAPFFSSSSSLSDEGTCSPLPLMFSIEKNVFSLDKGVEEEKKEEEKEEEKEDEEACFLACSL